MLRRLLPIMFILAFIFLLVLPVFAQDNTPEPTAEATVEFLDQLPMTPTGKVNRKVLSEPVA